MNQYIRLYLNNRGIPTDIAQEAANLITPSQLEAGVIETNAALTLLLGTFIKLYEAEGAEALNTLKGGLIG